MYMSRFSLNLLSALLMALLLAGCKVELYSNLNQQEANEMLAVLMKHNIDASKTHGKKESIILLVDEAQVGMAVDILKQNGYPSQSFSDMGDVFKKEGLISSPLEERARYIYAISQDLGFTLSKLDGVLSARVHVVLPDADKLGKVLRPSSAAVFIKHRKEVDVESSIPKIKMLVNNSIEGLDYDKISVALFPSVVLPDTIDVRKSKSNGAGFQFSSTMMFVIMILFLMCVLFSLYLYFQWQNTKKMLKKNQRSSARFAKE